MYCRAAETAMLLREDLLRCAIEDHIDQSGLGRVRDCLGGEKRAATIMSNMLAKLWSPKLERSNPGSIVVLGAAANTLQKLYIPSAAGDTIPVQRDSYGGIEQIEPTFYRPCDGRTISVCVDGIRFNDFGMNGAHMYALNMLHRLPENAGGARYNTSVRTVIRDIGYNPVDKGDPRPFEAPIALSVVIAYPSRNGNYDCMRAGLHFEESGDRVNNIWFKVSDLGQALIVHPEATRSFYRGLGVLGCDAA
mgnify:FL=1